MTLIELILSIAIAALLVTLVFSVYHTVSLTMQGQDERRRGAEAAAGAVRQMARDITCTFAPKSDEMCKFSLEKDPAAPIATRLSFCTAILPDNEADRRWFELHRVIYRVGIDTKNSTTLFRENQPLVGPGAIAAPVTNILVNGVESFNVTVYDGAEWKDEWTSLDALPRAARIELTARYGAGTKTFQAEVLIPAGNPVTSSVSRASASGTL